MSKSTTRSNTAQRIVEASLFLFNEHGERTISTNHIASHMNISPGNLYYHFNNKDEIIVQLFKRYSNEQFAYLSQTKLPENVPQAIDYMMGVYNIMWNYRFLFRDVNALLVRSGELLGEHNEFTRAKISPLLAKLLIKLNDLEVIEIDERGTQDLAINMWMVSKYWFDFDNSLHPQDKLEEDSKQRGVYRTLSLLRPYLRENHRGQFDELLAQPQ